MGPSNLVTLLEHTEAYRRDLRRVEYGDERDPKIREYLEKTAPLNNSEKIRKPVYAVVGKNDPRVPWTESRQMLDKLKSNGIQTWFLMANDEGHGYAKKKNQDFLFYSTIVFVQQFLLGAERKWKRALKRSSFPPCFKANTKGRLGGLCILRQTCNQWIGTDWKAAPHFFGLYGLTSPSDQRTIIAIQGQIAGCGSNGVGQSEFEH